MHYEILVRNILASDASFWIRSLFHATYDVYLYLIYMFIVGYITHISFKLNVTFPFFSLKNNIFPPPFPGCSSNKCNNSSCRITSTLPPHPNEEDQLPTEIRRGFLCTTDSPLHRLTTTEGDLERPQTRTQTALSDPSALRDLRGAWVRRQSPLRPSPVVRRLLDITWTITLRLFILI